MTAVKREQNVIEDGVTFLRCCVLSFQALPCHSYIVFRYPFALKMFSSAGREVMCLIYLDNFQVDKCVNLKVRLLFLLFGE